ncbi:MAG: hypothetical protein M3430_12615 [Acidobacteriota bacterium]|nr:hypothetical protein [Acidobacteriota bacterium]
MSTDLKRVVVEKLQTPTEEQQRKVLTFIEELKRRQPARQTIWERLDERLSKLPPDRNV